MIENVIRTDEIGISTLLNWKWFSASLLVFLACFIGFEAPRLFATPAPSRNLTCTPGACGTEPCDIRVYLDSSQVGAANCRSGDNFGFRADGNVALAFNNLVFPNCPALPSACSVYVESGVYIIPATGSGPCPNGISGNCGIIISQNKTTIWSNMGATIQYNSGAGASLAAMIFGFGKSQITVSGLVIDGVTGTDVSTSEATGGINCYGCNGVSILNNKYTHLSGEFVDIVSERPGFTVRSSNVLISGNQYIDSGNSTGGGISLTETDNAIVTGNTISTYDSTFTIVRATRITISQNTLSSCVGPILDVFDQNAGEILRDIVVDGNNMRIVACGASGASTPINFRANNLNSLLAHIQVINNIVSGQRRDTGSDISFSTSGGAIGRDFIITGNTFRNSTDDGVNHRERGIQITTGGGAATPSLVGLVIANNYVGFHQGAGLYASVTGTMTPANTLAIGAIVSGNVFETNSMLADTGTQVISMVNSTFSGNIFTDVTGKQTTAFQEDANDNHNTFSGNVFGSGVTSPFAGGPPVNEIRVNNYNYNPQPVSSNTAGASPFTTAKQFYPQQVQITTLNGQTGWTCNGIAMSNTALAYSPVLQPGQTCILTWATTAPVYELYPQ